MDTMNETTITTLVTVLGMLAAFITAFLAEPVKIYFQNLTKLRDLKVGLYKEMWEIYLVFTQIREMPENPTPDMDSELQTAGDVYATSLLLKNGLRNEYFQHALKDELSLFYRLPEASMINAMHRILVAIPDMLERDHEDREEVKISMELFLIVCNGYQDGFSVACYQERLDQKLLKTILGKDEFRKLFEKGKMYAADRKTDQKTFV
jgi:hypothetical protein